jgi:hypothetical protein
MRIATMISRKKTGVDGGRRTEDGTYPNVEEERLKSAERPTAADVATTSFRAPVTEDPFATSFPSAQRASDKPDYSPALRRVVESILLVEDEIEATAKRLVAELRIGDARSDYGTVMKRLDEAEDNARAAHRLSVTARAELERFETNARVIESALREKALERLEHDRAAAKAATGKSKDITETDVKATIAQHFADEWSALSSDRGRLKLAIDHLDHQVSNWSSRCKSLQTIASKLR